MTNMEAALEYASRGLMVFPCGIDKTPLTENGFKNASKDPQQIRDQVFEGIEQAGGAAKTTEIADRKEAIKKALGVATKGDTVLITGMGHEVYRIVNGKQIPWNDAEVVRELLKEKA